jgi:hypothetical protein
MLNLEQKLESLLTLEGKVKSGPVRNCFLRIEEGTENFGAQLPVEGEYAAMVELFCPKVDEDDYRTIKSSLDQGGIENRSWNDTGVRFLIRKDLPSPSQAAGDLIDKITGHFAKKYLDIAFKQFKSYPCGDLSTVTLIHVGDDLVLKYCEELRKDFTKNFLKAVCDSGKRKYKKIFINAYEFGTLESRGKTVEMHRWENEDEAQGISYLSRHYTQRILDGVLDDPGVKQTMINSMRNSLEGKAIDGEHLKVFMGALEYLDSCGFE